MRVPVVLAVLLCATLAGCSADGPKSDSTAEKGLDKAQARAAEWQAEAILIGVVGLEVAETTDDLDEESAEAKAAIPRDDDEVGDGKAPAWMYFFAHDDHLFLVVTSGTKVTFASDEFDPDLAKPLPASASAPLPSFDIDSDRAAEIAAAADGNFTNATKGRAVGIMTLAIDPATEGPVWTLQAFSEQGAASVRVSATDGAVLATGTDGFIPSVPDPLLRETGSVNADSTATTPGEDTFVIEDDEHMNISFRLSSNFVSPTATVTVTVTDPNGDDYVLEITNPGAELQQQDTLQLDMPAAGTWSVVGALTSGVRVSWSLQYCTDGLDNDDNEPNQACL